MKQAIRKIDRAIKDLYHLEIKENAADFLIRKPIQSAPRENLGSLYLRNEGDQLSIGIYFHPKIREELSDYRRWNEIHWTDRQINAFSTATEEISHFLYLLHHSQKGRAVSQFELEMQGEIDKFLLLYFAARNQDPHTEFDEIFERVFFQFRWASGLNEEEKIRYSDANVHARQAILKMRRMLKKNSGMEQILAFLRRFYHSGSSEKISLTAK